MHMNRQEDEQAPLLLAHDLRLLTIILPELLPVIATAAGQAGSGDRWQTTVRALELLPPAGEDEPVP